MKPTEEGIEEDRSGLAAAPETEGQALPRWLPSSCVALVGAEVLLLLGAAFLQQEVGYLVCLPLIVAVTLVLHRWGVVFTAVTLAGCAGCLAVISAVSWYRVDRGLLEGRPWPLFATFAGVIFLASVRFRRMPWLRAAAHASTATLTLALAGGTMILIGLTALGTPATPVQIVLCFVPTLAMMAMIRALARKELESPDRRFALCVLTVLLLLFPLWLVSKISSLAMALGLAWIVSTLLIDLILFGFGWSQPSERRGEVGSR